ncbi:MAG: PaaI family thioesterase, partial [Verrucomicrobia bacterium]|nr:PaaI family thioesterase [Verrucomicrobiota bacterium]
MTHISDPHFAKRVLASFDKQSAMHLVKATIPVVEHGLTEIHVPHWEGIEQQHGFVHGGVVGMIADSSAGYAAMTMVPAS